MFGRSLSALGVIVALQGIAQAEPPRAYGCGDTPPAESVGRLLDSLSRLLDTVSSALPRPPQSELDRARERTAAFDATSRRHAHGLSEEVRAHLPPAWDAPRLVSKRKDIESRMRVEIRLDETALRALRETGALPRVAAPPGTGLAETVVRGEVSISRVPRVPAPGEAIVTLKTARIADRTLLVTPGAPPSSALLWTHGAIALFHRAVVPGVHPKPEAIVLGPITAEDIESIE